jgi:hypothetical protein
MGLVISARVREKLAHKTPPVTEEEIVQCFETRSGRFLSDKREENQTDPPTRWFISETHYGRELKVVFIPKNNGDGNIDIIIKMAYDPNNTEREIYRNFG